MIRLVKTLVCNIIIVSCLKVTNITNKELSFTYVRLHLKNMMYTYIHTRVCGGILI